MLGKNADILAPTPSSSSSSSSSEEDSATASDGCHVAPDFAASTRPCAATTWALSDEAFGDRVTAGSRRRDRMDGVGGAGAVAHRRRLLHTTLVTSDKGFSQNGNGYVERVAR